MAKSVSIKSDIQKVKLFQLIEGNAAKFLTQLDKIKNATTTAPEDTIEDLKQRLDAQVQQRQQNYPKLLDLLKKSDARDERHAQRKVTAISSAPHLTLASGDDSTPSTSNKRPAIRDERPGSKRTKGL